MFCSGPMLLETTGELAQTDRAQWAADTKNTSGLAQTFKLPKQSSWTNIQFELNNVDMAFNNREKSLIKNESLPNYWSQQDLANLGNN